jgi:hypothetical protein
MAESTDKKGTYTVLSNLHHAPVDNSKDKKGRLYRKGDKVTLSDEHAAPLLKSKVIEPAK